MQRIKKLLVIIGSGKAGTSALANHLSLHPSLNLGIEKEPKFFTNFRSIEWIGPGANGHTRSIVESPEGYLQNFPNLNGDTWAIDASTDYIWCKESPALISNFAQNCDVRIIALVRDPVERAVSQYNHTLRSGWESLSFLDAVRAEKTRFEQGWHPLFYHARRSRVHDDIMTFHRIFSDRLMVMDYEELRSPETLMKRLTTFLDLPMHASSSIEEKNVSFLPRSRLAKQMLGSKGLRAVGRAIFPRSLRSSIWKMLHTNARNLRTVQPDEMEEFRNLLSDEIANCVNEPLIPTSNWKCTR